MPPILSDQAAAGKLGVGLGMRWPSAWHSLSQAEAAEEHVFTTLTGSRAFVILWREKHKRSNGTEGKGRRGDSTEEYFLMEIGKGT